MAQSEPEGQHHCHHRSNGSHGKEDGDYYHSAEIIPGGRIHKQGNKRFTWPQYKYQKKYPGREILSFALMNVGVGSVVTVFMNMHDAVGMIMLVHMLFLPVQTADAYQHVNQAECNQDPGCNIAPERFEELEPRQGNACRNTDEPQDYGTQHVSHPT